MRRIDVKSVLPFEKVTLQAEYIISEWFYVSSIILVVVDHAGFMGVGGLTHANAVRSRE